MKEQVNPASRPAPLEATLEEMTLDAYVAFERSERARSGYTMSRFQVLVLLFTGALFAGILLMPLPQGLSSEGRAAIAVFAVALCLWTTNVIPLAITGLLTMALLPILNVAKANEVYSFFGNSAVFFILGAFIIAAGMMSSGLSTRFALTFLRGFDRSPTRLLMGIMISAWFLSFWMSEHAVIAMIFPIVLEIARALDLKPMRDNYGRALLLSLVWGAVVGGAATFLGGARIPLALGIFQKTYPKHAGIGFFEFMLAMFPIVVAMLFVSFVVLVLVFRHDITNIRPARKVLLEKTRAMGPMSAREKLMGVLILLTIAAWMMGSKSIGLANIAIFAVALMFVLNLVSWKEIEPNVNWGVILLYGGAIALATAIEKTKAADWAVTALLARVHASPLVILSGMALLALILTELISNSAVAALMLPVGFSLADRFHLDPRLVIYFVAVPTGFAFVLPMGSAGNMIAYSSGYFSIGDMARPGAVLGFTAWVLVVASALFYWPHLGMALR
jgi:sodium-dependent dicarboxylate transporter 2/3/5